MSGRWSKLDAGFIRHPKSRAAGRLGREVFVYALCVNAEGGYDGQIPIGYFGPNYLARELEMSVDEAAAALDACHAADLLESDALFVRIVGWDPIEWGSGKPSDRSEAARERKRRSRERQRKAANSVTRDEPDVSRGHAVTPEERRGEEKRDHGDFLAEGTGTKHQPPPRQQFDFETVYQLYPRKAGKQAGLKKAKQSVRTEADYQALLGAVQRMSELWRGHDVTFCPHWSTFVSQERWRDEQLPSPSATASQVATVSQDLPPGVERW